MNWIPLCGPAFLTTRAAYTGPMDVKPVESHQAGAPFRPKPSLPQSAFPVIDGLPSLAVRVVQVLVPTPSPGVRPVMFFQGCIPKGRGTVLFV